MDELKTIIAENIVFYRKESGLTQAELAEKLNYSDKAVSKWERAESYPDVATLARLSKLFGVTVDELITDRKKVKKFKPIVALLAAGLVLLVATVAYALVGMFLPDFKRSWLIFIYAALAISIVLLVLFAVWRKKLAVLICESAIMWSLAVCIFLTIPAIQNNFFIFFVPIPLQILAVLWYAMRKKNKTNLKPKRRRVRNPKDNDQN